MPLLQFAFVRADKESRKLRRLLRIYRLRWLKQQTSEVLARHKQALIVILCILPFSARVLAWPVMALGLMRPSQPLVDAGLLALLNALALLWVMSYRGAIDGGQFSAYLRTLPISSREFSTANICTAAVSDVVFWIIFIIALVITPYADLDDLHTTLFIWRLGLLAGLIVAVQVCFLQDWRAALIVMIAGDGLLWLSGRIGPSVSAIVLMLTSGVCIGAMIAPRFRGLRRLKAANSPPSNAMRARSFLYAALRLYLALLWRDRRTSSLARLGGALLIFAGAITLISLGAWQNHTFVFLGVCLGFAALLLSGIIRQMRTLRLSMAPLLNTLPVSAMRWARAKIIGPETFVPH